MEILIMSLDKFRKMDWNSGKFVAIRIFDSCKCYDSDIFEENSRLMNEGFVKDILTLFFDDIEDPYNEQNKILIDYGIIVPFLDEHLYQIATFVKKYMEYDFIIHCVAGASRSPAVAYGIYLLLNNDGKYTDKLRQLERDYFLMNKYMKSKFEEFVKKGMIMSNANLFDM